MIILAPHVDDEVIGCFRYLHGRQVERVYYFFEVDEIRKAEAQRCSEHFDFEARFVSVEEAYKEIQESFGSSVLLLPNCHDFHADHKTINNTFRTLPNEKNFYSVDMNVERDTLYNEYQQEKLQTLNTLFPSQAGLFASDEKYHLFESCLDTDIDTSYEYEFDVSTWGGTERSYSALSNEKFTITLSRPLTLLETERCKNLAQKGVPDLEKLIRVIPKSSIELKYRTQEHTVKQRYSL